MIVYVIRHAKAVDRAKWKGADTKRPLTPKGVKTMKRVAASLKKTYSLRLDMILSSPFARACDTAQILAKGFHAKKKLRLVDELMPHGDLHRFLNRTLSEYPAKSRIAVVGHEPDLSRLIALLLRQSGRMSLDFKKGGLCRIDIEGTPGAGRGVLKWFLPPKLILLS